MLVKSLSSQTRDRLIKLSDAAPLIEAAKLLCAGAEIVTVCNAAGILAGVLTKTDVVRQISRCEGASCTAPAALVMSRDIVTCSPEDWIQDVWAAMKRTRLKNIPVVDSANKPVGVLNARDALEALLGEVESEEGLLRDYVMSVGYH